jgi:hypothetical protein
MAKPRAKFLTVLCWINSFCSSLCALWRWFRMLYKQQKSSRHWQWQDGKIIFNFFLL